MLITEQQGAAVERPSHTHITEVLTAWKHPRNTDLNHGFGQQLRPEQLQHGVHDVLPALPQDVTMPMGKVKHRLGCCLCLAVTSKHARKVFY